MSYRFKEPTDSFSCTDEPNYDSAPPDNFSNKKSRNDSPIFGISPNHPLARSYNSISESNQQASFNEYQNSESHSQQPRLNTMSKIGHLGSDHISGMNIMKKYDPAAISQVIMHANYQKVLLKIEISITKLSQLISRKIIIGLSMAFTKIQNHDIVNRLSLQYKSLKIYNRFESKILRLIKAISKTVEKQKLKIFITLVSFAKIKINKIKYEKNKAKLITKCSEIEEIKNKEIMMLAQKIQDNVSSAKFVENELKEKLKKRENRIEILELENAELSKKKLPTVVVDPNEIRQLQDKIKELMQENEDLRKNMKSTENNMESFISDMTELLKSHEISVNSTTSGTTTILKSGGGNIPNNHHLMNHDIPEDNDNHFNYYDKPDENSQGYRNKGLHYQGNNYKSNQHDIKQNPRSSSSNQYQMKYPKNYQINYCFTQLKTCVTKDNIQYPRILSHKELHQPFIQKSDMKKSRIEIEQELNLKENNKNIDWNKFADLNIQDKLKPTILTSKLMDFEPLSLKSKNQQISDDFDFIKKERPREVKQITWDKNGKDNNTRPKIQMAPMNDSYMSSNASGMFGEKGTNLDKNDNSWRNSANNNNNKNNNSNNNGGNNNGDENNSFNSENQILEEAARIQFSLRYILGLYKIHCIFLETMTKKSNKEEVFLIFKSLKLKNPMGLNSPSYSNMESKEYDNSVQQLCPMELQENPSSESYFSDTQLPNISNIMKNDTEIMLIAPDSFRAPINQMNLHSQSDTNLKNNYPSFDAKNSQNEINEKIIRNNSMPIIQEAEQNLRNKEIHIQRFLQEEMRKLEQLEMDLKVKESSLKIREEQLQKEKLSIEEKQREVNLMLIDQRTQPLVCLNNKKELKERLKSYKFNLYKYYLAGLDSNAVNSMKFEAEIDKENDEFFDVFKDFPDTQQAIQKRASLLKNYELQLISEKTKLDIGSNYFKTELEKLVLEKQELEKERAKLSELHELEKRLLEENKNLMDKGAKINNQHMILKRKEGMLREYSAQKGIKLEELDLIDRLVPIASQKSPDEKNISHHLSSMNDKKVKELEEKENILKMKEAHLAEQKLELEAYKKVLEKENSLLQEEKSFFQVEKSIIMDQISNSMNVPQKLFDDNQLPFRESIIFQPNESIMEIPKFTARSGFKTTKFGHSGLNDEVEKNTDDSLDEMIFALSDVEKKWKTSQVLLKWFRYSSMKTDIQNKAQVYINSFFFWKLITILSNLKYQQDLMIQKRFNGDWLNQKWKDKKNEFINSYRYPMKILSKKERERECALFDYERKTFYKSRIIHLLSSVFRQQRRKLRTLKLTAFTRFVFVAAQMKEKAIKAKFSLPRDATSREYLPNNAHNTSIDSLFRNAKTRPQNSKISEGEENSFDTNTVRFKGPNSNYVVSNPITTSRHEDSFNNIKPEKKSTTPIRNNKKAQCNASSLSKSPVFNSREKSKTPSTLVPKKEDVEILKKFRSLYIVMIVLMRHKLISKYHVCHSFARWKQVKNEEIKRSLNEDFYEMNLALNEQVFKENAFRTKIKLQKSELESKISILQQMVTSIISAKQNQQKRGQNILYCLF